MIELLHRAVRASLSEPGRNQASGSMQLVLGDVATTVTENKCSNFILSLQVSPKYRLNATFTVVVFWSGAFFYSS